MFSTGTSFVFDAANDLGTVGGRIIDVSRSGSTVLTIQYGNATDLPTHTFQGQVIGTTNILAQTSTAYTNGAGAAVGTLNNAPAAGNPTKWISINDNGTIRRIPAW
jgi:hypothetical protein